MDLDNGYNYTPRPDDKCITLHAVISVFYRW